MVKRRNNCLVKNHWFDNKVIVRDGLPYDEIREINKKYREKYLSKKIFLFVGTTALLLFWYFE
ncbi:hypothetical protein QFZ87_003615 [Bacillus sp. SLBN-46]|nr:hypothetical protein [Bacillus sp. SLBN-46]